MNLFLWWLPHRSELPFVFMCPSSFRKRRKLLFVCDFVEKICTAICKHYIWCVIDNNIASIPQKACNHLGTTVVINFYRKPVYQLEILVRTFQTRPDKIIQKLCSFFCLHSGSSMVPGVHYSFCITPSLCIFPTSNPLFNTWRISTRSKTGNVIL